MTTEEADREKGIDQRTGEKIIERPSDARPEIPDHHDGDGDDDFERLMAKRREESRLKDEEE